MRHDRRHPATQTLISRPLIQMSTHSELPWQYQMAGHENGTVQDKNGVHICVPCWHNHGQHAQYIVHACNLYPQLVEALREALIVMEANGLDPLGCDNIRAVLAQIEGK